MSFENKRKSSVESMTSIISLNSGSANSLSSMDSRSYSFDESVTNNTFSVGLDINNDNPEFIKKVNSVKNNFLDNKKIGKRREREIKRNDTQSPNIDSVISKLSKSNLNDKSLYITLTTLKPE